MTRIATVCHSRDGYILRLDEVPLWALAIDRLIEHVVLPATFHLVCCRVPA